MIESKAFQSCFMYKETSFLTKRDGKGIILHINAVYSCSLEDSIMGVIWQI